VPSAGVYVCAGSWVCINVMCINVVGPHTRSRFFYERSVACHSMRCDDVVFKSHDVTCFMKKATATLLFCYIHRSDSNSTLTCPTATLLSCYIHMYSLVTYTCTLLLHTHVLSCYIHMYDSNSTLTCTLLRYMYTYEHTHCIRMSTLAVASVYVTSVYVTSVYVTSVCVR